MIRGAARGLDADNHTIEHCCIQHAAAPANAERSVSCPRRKGPAAQGDKWLGCGAGQRLAQSRRPHATSALRDLHRVGLCGQDKAKAPMRAGRIDHYLP
jgi:hypothetical protein